MAPLTPFDTQMRLLGKVLDLRAGNAQVISSNIANAETPGYAPARFEFEQELSDALQKQNGVRLATTSPAHIPLGPANFQQVSGKIVTVEDRTPIGDENGVSIEKEMLALSENELLYETAAQLLGKKLTLLKYVISGGQ
jgi:flagellar basal-body rod protein FlgB